jgi:rod shape-determining protein MreC
MPKKFIAVLIILIVAFFSIKFTGIERTAVTPVEKIIRETLAPLQNGVNIVTNKILNIKNYIITNKSLQKENKILKDKIYALTVENTLLEEYRQENVRLKLLIDNKNQNDEYWETTAAHVIARDYNNWFHSIVVNKGSKDGIKRDMVVVNYQGLVGRVVNVTPNTSEVLLITDSESAVGALIQTTRVHGILESALEAEEKLQMVHIPHDAPIPKNAVVVSSGLGSIFPKGLRLGYVKSIVSASNGLVKMVMVKPFVDFNSLEEVLIIKNEFKEVNKEASQ